MRGRVGKKSWQHPKDFPSGPPPQYYPGPVTVNFRVLKRSGVFVTVWPPANSKDLCCLGVEFDTLEKSARLALVKMFVFWPW